MILGSNEMTDDRNRRPVTKYDFVDNPGEQTHETDRLLALF